MGEIREGYLAKLKKYREENPDEIQIVITRVAQHPLSPSWELLKDIKSGRITWKTFTERLEAEIANNPEALKALYEIAVLSLNKNIRLICYEKNPPCHRFIIRDWGLKLKWSYSPEELTELAK